MWQKTNNHLQKEMEEYQRRAEDLRDEVDGLKDKLDDERKRTRQIEDDYDRANAAKEEAERQFRELELQLASSKNTQTGLNLKVADMYHKQSKYQNEIRRMNSKVMDRGDFERDEGYDSRDDDYKYNNG